jgi:hypothetical protein
MPSLSRPLAFAGLLVCLLRSPASMAQTPASGTDAEQRFRRGQSLFQAGRVAEACREFEESQRLEPALGTLLNMANCHERLERLLLAMREFQEAASSAHSAGITDVESFARERASALAREIPSLEVRVDRATAPAGLSVRLESALIAPPEWGIPRPLEPGRYRIEASAPGRVSFQKELTLARGGGRLIVQIPNLLEAAPATESDTSSDASSDTSSEMRFGPRRVAAVVAGGVGVAGVVTGAIFGLRSMSKHDDAEEYCDSGRCTDRRGVDLSDQALTAGNVSTIAFAVGAAGLAGGAVLWFTGETNRESATAPTIGVGLSGVSVAGRF